jgi:ParB-like chromosome segregation protein Spo0J
MEDKQIILGATIHPLAAMFPLLEGEEFEQLVESIDKHGIQTPILLLHHPPGHPRHKKGEPLIVVDGRNRLRAWERLANQGKVDRDYWINYVRVLSYDGDPNDEAYIRNCILAANIHRRHLTPDQRAAIMLRLTGEQICKQTAEVKKASTAKARAAKSVDQKSGPQNKRDVKAKHANSAAGQLAAAAKVGRHTAANAIEVAKAEESGKLPPGTMKAVEEGTTTLAKEKKKAESSTNRTTQAAKANGVKPVATGKAKSQGKQIDKDTFRFIAGEWLDADRDSFREELDAWYARLKR